MTIQEALMIAGQASAIMAVLLLALAARTYVLEDIRGVRDDLSGRRRMRGMREARRKVTRAATREDGMTAHHLAELPTQASVRGREEDATLADSRETPKSAPFVVTRDVVVCPGGDL